MVCTVLSIECDERKIEMFFLDLYISQRLSIDICEEEWIHVRIRIPVLKLEFPFLWRVPLGLEVEVEARCQVRLSKTIKIQKDVLWNGICRLRFWIATTKVNVNVNVNVKVKVKVKVRVLATRMTFKS